MTTSTHPGSGSARKLPSTLWQRLLNIDRAAWRRFLLAMLGLGLALFLALYATALRQTGRPTLGALTALISLLVAALIALRVVPYLARRTALERWMTKIEYEITREGVAYLGIVAVIAIAAANTGNNLLFIILSCLLAGILASGGLSKMMLDRLEIEIVLPERVFAERPAMARFRLVNTKQLFASFSVTVSARRPSRRKTAERPLPPESAILNQGIYIPYVPPRSAVSQSVELAFPKRGRYTQEGFRVSTKFPFGFLRKSHEVPSPREVLALPNVQPTKRFHEILPLIGSEMESHLKGQGHDFYAIRDYQGTDTVRHVDWKATAKAQQLKIREFAREDERRLGLIFDPWLPDAQQMTLEKFERAVTFCACLAWHFYELGTLLQFDTHDFGVPMAPAAESIYPILEKLALIEPIVARAPRIAGWSRRPSVTSGVFRIILTFQPRGLIPAFHAGPSSIVFMDTL